MAERQLPKGRNR